MLSQQDIQRMLDEMGVSFITDDSRFLNLENLQRLSLLNIANKTFTFIEITSTTKVEEEEKHGELGRDPQPNKQVWQYS